MSSKKLRAELLDDPLARNYAGMSDNEAATDLNDETLRPMADVTTLIASEVYDIIDRAEMNSLDPADANDVNVILGLSGRIEVGAGSEFQKTMVALFNAVSNTRANFLAVTTNLTQSRGQELAIIESALNADGVAACRIPDQPEGVEA